jgi:hypothetical protein
MNPFGNDAAGAAGAAAFQKQKPDQSEEKERETQRNRLIEIALTSGICFWHDADGVAFASVPVGGHIERYRVRAGRFKLLLRRLYGAAYPNLKASKKLGCTIPGGVSESAMNEALPTLEAVAQTGTMREPRVRVYRDRADGTVWIDLGDETWSLIAVTASGWQVVGKADVPLVRSKSMRSLPVPQYDPDALNKLRSLLNLNPSNRAPKATVKLANDCFKIVVAFMLSVLWPRGPYCILIVNGEQGSAKSTMCRVIRAMTDPNKVPLRKVPRNPDDLLVTAQHCRLLALDNVSFLVVDLADLLCGIATGIGDAKRQLYSDADESILEALNPILINGIEGLMTRPDLTDRSLSVMLAPIDDKIRRDEAEIDEEIARVAPGVLALLLDALVQVMRALPTLKLSRMPRMADFARLACAAAPAFGWTAEEMLAALEDNRKLTVEAVLAADPVATAVLDLLHGRSSNLDGWFWVGSPTDLLTVLKDFVPADTAKSKAWPKTSHYLSGRLKRAAPALRRAGFSIATWREDKDRNRRIGIRAVARAEDRRDSAPPAPGASVQQNSSAVLDGYEQVLADASEDFADASEGASVRQPGGEVVADAQSRPASAGASATSAGQGSDKAKEYDYAAATDAADAEMHVTYPSADEDEDHDDEERI